MSTLLDDVLANHKRVAFVGGPGTGKTTASERVRDRMVMHTDQYKHIPWDRQPAVINKHVSRFRRFVLEGVQTARCLRAGLDVDAVVVFEKVYKKLNARQEGLAKTVRKVFQDWRDGTGNGVPVYWITALD